MCLVAQIQKYSEKAREVSVPAGRECIQGTLGRDIYGRSQKAF